MRGRSPALNEEVFAREAGTSAEVMSIPDVVRACLSLLTILLITGALGWYWIGDPGSAISIPIWFWISLIGALLIGIVTVVRPQVAPFTAPAYAAVEGLVVGAISRIYEFEFDGIVLQAVGLTIGVFAVLLALYASRLIKVTENFRLGVIAATGRSSSCTWSTSCFVSSAPRSRISTTPARSESRSALSSSPSRR